MDEHEVEVMAPDAETIDTGVLALLNKSEIDQQITTAKHYRRSTKQFLSRATELATQDAETADECIYALPRDGKTIEGPSARFAEIIAYAWGNCRAGARVISEDEEFVTAQGSFFDMEQNVHIGYEVRRRITNRAGKRFNADMISTTANAACSIALRNAVLKGVPKAAWRTVYNRARQTIAGDFKTLIARRAEAMKQCQLLGAQPEQIFALLDVKGVDDMTLDHLVALKGVLNAIREGETTVARAFAPRDTQDDSLASKSTANMAGIKDRYNKTGPSQQAPPPQKETAAPADAPRGAEAQPSAAGGAVTTEEAPKASTPEVPPVEEPEYSHCHKHGDHEGLECPTCKAEEVGEQPQQQIFDPLQAAQKVVDHQRGKNRR